MAKKKTTNKSSKKTSAKEDFDLVKVLKNRALKWNGWDELSIWEKNTSTTAIDWKKKIIKYIIVVGKNIHKKHPNYFEKMNNEQLNDFIAECFRRIYQSEYIPEAKPARVGSSGEYVIFNLKQADYFDWGKKKFDEKYAEYAQASSEAKTLMQDKKEVDVTYVDDQKIVIPIMKWGKTTRPIPRNAFMGSAIGAAMLLSDFEQACREGDESELWNKNMPVVIDLGSDVPNEVHFGLKTKIVDGKEVDNEQYIKFEENEFYTGLFSSQKGNKIKDEESGKTYYSYEGQVTTEEIEVNGEKTKIKKYEGQRSYMYNLKPLKDHKIKPLDINEYYKGNVNEFKEYVINDVIYETFASVLGEIGLAGLPEFFNTHNVLQKKTGVRDSIHPVGFETDVISRYKTEDDPKDPDKFIVRSIRADDKLDFKNVMDGDKEFNEININMNNVSDELLEEFDNIAEGSRLKVIVNLSRKTDSDFIQANCIWYKLIKSTALDTNIFTNDMFNMEDSDEEFSIEINDDEEESDEEGLDDEDIEELDVEEAEGLDDEEIDFED